MDWNQVFSIVSLCISVLVAFAVIVGTFQQRKHNRLSVKPILHTWIHAEGDTQVQYIIENSGVGPALIETHTILASGKEYEGSRTGLTSFISDTLGVEYALLADDDIVDLHFPFALRAGQKLIMAGLKVPGSQFGAAKSIAEKLRANTEINISYKDIYGKSFQYSVP